MVKPLNPQSAIRNPKLKTVSELKRLVSSFHEAGTRVVLANGCFDLLHVGHTRYLREAKALGDILIVAINSDSSVAVIKGHGRPLQSQDERSEIVGALECVDYVTVFDAPTVDGILLQLTPDIHAKGTDYSSDTVPERETVRSYGGSVAIVGDPKSHSTRDLIETILAKQNP
jgi:rfaE bifunctional protein nucleotidyltransferase chain/domain